MHVTSIFPFGLTFNEAIEINEKLITPNLEVGTQNWTQFSKHEHINSTGYKTFIHVIMILNCTNNLQTHHI